MTADERKQRQEARKKRAEERAAEEKRDEALVLETVRSILRDDRATPGEKLLSICILDNMRYYHFCPSDIPILDKPQDDVLARLRERYKAELAGDQASSTT